MAAPDPLWHPSPQPLLQLSGYAEAAQAFLELRDALKLTGDFQLVENIALQVSRVLLISPHTT